MIAAEESSYLNVGTKGVTIGKQFIKDDRPVALPISNTKNATKNRLPRLYRNDYKRRWEGSK